MKSLKPLLCILLFTACATSPEPSDENLILNVGAIENSQNIDMALMLAQQRALDRLEAQGDQDDRAQITNYKKQKPTQHEYVLKTKSDHPKVQKWIQYYSVKDRERFQRFLNRGAPYKQVIQDIFVANGLPPDLYYLGILESGYVHQAISHAGAVGPWQFMAPTGREYGLKINNYVDERVDPIRATLAASRYLKELYRQKKSWHLALAAYNAGPGRVRRAMRRARRRGRAQTYWSLTQRRLLPYDTREYIPQFLAILYVGKNLEKFNFTEEIKKPLAPMELVKVPSPIHLKKIAELTGVSVKEIKSINPHLVRDMTPPGAEDYPVWFKKQWKQKAVDAYAKLEEHRIKGLKLRRRVASAFSRRRVHRVRRGQNLSTIARRYGVRVSQIKRWNRLKSNRIYVGQRLRVRSSGVGQTRYSKRKVAYHKVRKGQNLTSIAKRYGMSVSRIKRLNKMRSSKIYVGQKLKVHGVTRKIASKNNGVKRYKIRRGDNLSRIAKKFGLTIRRLKKMNKLTSNKIMKGQVLIVSR